MIHFDNDVDYTQKYISFCSGYGGIELGLRRISRAFKCVCYVEIESYAQANLVTKIENGLLDAAPVWSNLKTFPAQQFSGKVHGITGGYPCQPFSCAGRREGTVDPRHLWPHIQEHIRTIEPVWVYFENVDGHLSEGFNEVHTSLLDMGYTVEAGLFTASEVGAPHLRKRLFILGVRIGDAGLFRGFWSMANRERERCGGGINAVAGNIQERPVCKNESERYRVRSETTGCSRVNAEPAVFVCDCGGDRWPSRPCEPQYEWEPPRTVRTLSARKPTRLKEYQKTIESIVGRGADGDTEVVDSIVNRVDRLRLNGNGVVPQQAEKAFRYLANLHIGESND